MNPNDGTLNKRNMFLLLGLTLLLNQLSGQTFKEQFNVLVAQKDTLGQQQLLEKWEKTNSNDPELYVSYFNHYVITSRKDVIRLGQKPEGDDALQIMAEDTSKTEPVGYMFGDSYYDPVLLEKGFDWITKGIQQYPNRLDMRFGKIYMFGQLEDYANFTTEIINTIDYSNEIYNRWTWTDNESLDEPKDFMLRAIQDYQIQLYNTEKDELLENMQQIAEAVLKYYPNHIESLSNISIVYLLQEQYDQALEYLLRAEKINPKDYIVLSNIAHAYKRTGDKNMAIKYYELTLKHGDERAKQFAQRQLEELKKE